MFLKWPKNPLKQQITLWKIQRKNKHAQWTKGDKISVREPSILMVAYNRNSSVGDGHFWRKGRDDTGLMTAFEPLMTCSARLIELSTC